MNDLIKIEKTESGLAVSSRVIASELGKRHDHILRDCRDKNILRSNNQPYQKYIDNSCFRLIEQKYTKSDGSTHINIKTVMYQKGLDYIRKILKEVRQCQ